MNKIRTSSNVLMGSDASYTYTADYFREPAKGSMTEWYANDFCAKAYSRCLSINLRVFPLVEAYDILKIFGAFSPQWVY